MIVRIIPAIASRLLGTSVIDHGDGIQFRNFGDDLQLSHACLGQAACRCSLQTTSTTGASRDTVGSMETGMIVSIVPAVTGGLLGTSVIDLRNLQLAQRCLCQAALRCGLQATTTTGASRDTVDSMQASMIVPIVPTVASALGTLQLAQRCLRQAALSCSLQ